MKHLSIVVLTPVIALCVTAALSAQSPADLNRRGVELGKQKMYDEAIHEFNKSIKIYDETSARVYHNKGMVLEQKGKFIEAITNYEEAIRRNPGQIVSQERAGYLYYKTDQFEKAVETGEHVISVDPNNKSVASWLPDAYSKRLRERQLKLAEQKKREDEEKAKQAAVQCPEKKEEKAPKEHRVFYASYDFMIREAYYYKGSGFKYEEEKGLLLNVPNMLYLNFSPVPSFEFDLLAGNPYLGALSPNLVNFSSRVQAIYHLGNYYLGVGFLFNQYSDDFASGESETLYDYKGGLIFGAQRDAFSMRFLFYPRELPHDTKQSTGRTLDVDYLEYTFTYTFDRFLSFYVLMSVNDYYFFDHDLQVSNYYGVYNAGLGITLVKYDSVNNRRLVAVSFEFMIRMYLRNLNNDRPYKFFNGQGWMGADSETWFKGDAFPGFRTTGHVFSVRVEEWITNNFFLYQKLLFELAEGGEETDHNDLAILLGGGTAI